jgi:hypothetical protein
VAAICGGSAIALRLHQSFNQMKTDFNFFRRHFYPELNCIVFVSGNRALVTFKQEFGFGVLLRFTTPVQ